jgi:hypothetical protein
MITGLMIIRAGQNLTSHLIVMVKETIIVSVMEILAPASGFWWVVINILNT